MLKDLVVNLALGPAKDATADYALSIAETFEAQIAGIAFAFEPVIPASAAGGVAADVIGGAIAENERVATSAIERFEAAAKKRGVSFEGRRITALVADAVTTFAEIARRFDLAVVRQVDPKTAGPDDLFAHSALFTSGRPVVIVPYVEKGPVKLDRIACCWDGSQTAARAIHDAMPFLHKSKSIDLLMIVNDKLDRNEITGADMATHLARHGLRVNLARVPGAEIDVANAILSYAADNATDFLVMGGYGHSRWREFILGGATRGMLSTMTVPTLMSH